MHILDSANIRVGDSGTLKSCTLYWTTYLPEPRQNTCVFGNSRPIQSHISKYTVFRKKKRQKRFHSDALLKPLHQFYFKITEEYGIWYMQGKRQSIYFVNHEIRDTLVVPAELFYRLSTGGIFRQNRKYLLTLTQISW